MRRNFAALHGFRSEDIFCGSYDGTAGDAFDTWLMDCVKFVDIVVTFDVVQTEISST